MKPRQSNFWKVLATPTVIALLSAAGLFAALLGDGVWDALELAGLGHPRSPGPARLPATPLMATSPL